MKLIIHDNKIDIFGEYINDPQILSDMLMVNNNTIISE